VVQGLGPEVIADEGVGSREDWVLKAADKCTASANSADGFNMLDPIRRPSSRRDWT